MRGRVVVAAVAAGAFVSAGQTVNSSASAVPDNSALDSTAAMGLGSSVGVGGSAPAPEYLPVTRPAEPATADAVQAMAKGERFVAERAAREAEARRPLI
ncbi:MAG: M23 family peptidase, partial [Actinobacteria bacterium]|nr:M23 family peptidase [Actinomycetota bacterium]